jgi:transcription elongation factor Elf1
MTGLRSMGNGKLKCIFCNHKSYKRYGDALTHVQNNHALELANATVEEMRGEIDRLKKQPPKVVEKERIVYRDPPPAPPAPKKEYYQCVLYCKNENKVFKAGMPKGVLVENVTCADCGVRGALVITNNDPSWML